MASSPARDDVVVHVEAKQDEPCDTNVRVLDEISKELLSGCPILADKMKGEGWTLLHCAVSEGREDLVTRICSVAPEMIEQKRGGARVLDIAFEKMSENMLIRLFELCPNLIDSDYLKVTVLHRAALKGLDTVVAHLLAVKPQSIRAVTRKGQTVLDFAACGGHLAVVQRLLAASPALIDAIDKNGETALHLSTLNNGHVPVVTHLHLRGTTRLLAAKPEYSEAVGICFGWSALHYAITSGSVPVAEHLLAASPTLISAVGWGGESVLHVAASCGDCTMVEYLLSVSPALINAVDRTGCTVLHEAVLHDGPPLSIFAVVRALLAIKPDLISMTDDHGNTMLHLLVQYSESKEIIEEVWRLCPEALRAVNMPDDTPFHVAIAKENFDAIEVFQWHLTWEEIESAYASCFNTSTCKEKIRRFRPVMETQCESLSLWLLPEVVGTVFEYLGFERVKKGVEASPVPFPY